MSEQSDTEIEQILEGEPGNSVFCEFAERLRLEGNFPKAFDVCFAGLSANPTCHKGRLILARLFYEENYIPFAVREVEQLAKELPSNKYVKRLLLKLAPDTHIEDSSEEAEEVSGGDSDSSEDDTVAEVDFDFDELEMIEEDE